MRHQELVQKDFYLPERMLNVRVYFLAILVIFSIWGQVKRVVSLFVHFDSNLVSRLAIVKTIVIIWKAGAIQEMVCKLQLKKMCQISLTHLCRSEGTGVDLHIFTQVSIRD